MDEIQIANMVKHKRPAINKIHHSKEKRIRSEQTNTKSSATTTFNAYAELTDNEEEIDLQSTPIIKIKIPPIVVINMKHDQIKDFMAKSSITNYNLKYISLGIKILCKSVEDFNTTTKNLQHIKSEYFTHDIPSQKTTKFVLSGLPNIPIDQVKEGLTAANLKFLDVKKMHTKRDCEDFALFLIYFDNKSMKLQDLKQIKYILNVVVKWQPYIPSKNGPTQCNKCQLHGHGSKNCTLTPRCAKCAGKHETISCQISTEELIYKCCLCGDQHSSRDRQCPKRVNYIQMKLKQSSKNSNIHNISPNPKEQFDYENKTMFPALKVPKSQKFSNWFTNFNTNSNYTNTQHYINPPSHHTPSSHNENETLFSTETLLQLTTELINNLKNCQTKLDQFQVITKLAIKYINYN